MIMLKRSASLLKQFLLRQASRPIALDDFKLECGRVITLLSSLMGILFSLLAIFSCNFFNTAFLREQFDNNTNDALLSSVELVRLHMGLFRYTAFRHNEDDTFRWKDSAAMCHLYDDSVIDGRLIMARVFSIMAPILGAIGCLVTCWDIFLYPNFRWNHFVMTFAWFFASFAQILGYAALQSKDSCQGHGGYGGCTVAAGARLAIASAVFYAFSFAGSIYILRQKIHIKTKHFQQQKERRKQNDVVSSNASKDTDASSTMDIEMPLQAGPSRVPSSFSPKFTASSTSSSSSLGDLDLYSSCHDDDDDDDDENNDNTHMPDTSFDTTVTSFSADWYDAQLEEHPDDEVTMMVMTEPTADDENDDCNEVLHKSFGACSEEPFDCDLEAIRCVEEEEN